MADQSLVGGVIPHNATPASDARLYIVSDPTGTPADEYAEWGDIGMRWDLVIDEDGSDFATDWENISGTAFGSDGSTFTATLPASLNVARNKTVKLGGIVLLEAEVQFTTVGGSSSQCGIGVGNSTTSSPIAAVLLPDPDQLAVNRFGSGGGGTIGGVTTNASTWYKLRVLASGQRFTVYLDGTLIGSILCTGDFIASNMVLVGYDATVKLRNLKAWVANLGLPA